MFCLLSKFCMPRPFRLRVKRVLKLPDAKLNDSLCQEFQCTYLNKSHRQIVEDFPRIHRRLSKELVVTFLLDSQRNRLTLIFHIFF